jgi:acid phosphatase family membrane protein YuiD
MFAQIIGNFPLMAALAGVVAAQVLKLPVHALTEGKVDVSRIFSTGGMPSSHSAFVVSLVTALILTYGWSHPLVAIAIVFGVIVMYDAFGIRRESGKQATVINALTEEMDSVSKEVEGVMAAGKSRGENLEELLGHEPVEIAAGAVLGVVAALLLFQLY